MCGVAYFLPFLRGGWRGKNHLRSVSVLQNLSTPPPLMLKTKLIENILVKKEERFLVGGKSKKKTWYCLTEKVPMPPFPQTMLLSTPGKTRNHVNKSDLIHQPTIQPINKQMNQACTILFAYGTLCICRNDGFPKEPTRKSNQCIL